MKRIGVAMWKGIVELIRYIVRWICYKNRLESKVDMMMRRLLRLEILNAIERKDTTTVYALFDEYKAIGGNSYITHEVETYLKSSKRKKK